MARQKLGQHFLADAAWRKRILQTLDIAEGEVWLEIGAGHGEMTEHLANAGARVFAIETDPRLAAGLREKAAAWTNVKIVEGDVLSLDLRNIAGENFRVYGNLPYYITSPILRHLLGVADSIRSIHIVIQLEVAARIVAPPGRREHGYLSALCQFYTKPKIDLKIPAGAFRPPPRVTSALVRMTLPGEKADLQVADRTQFLEFIQRCFDQKRKTLRNNLRSSVGIERAETALKSCHLEPGVRGEQLTLAQFACLYHALHSA